MAETVEVIPDFKRMFATFSEATEHGASAMVAMLNGKRYTKVDMEEQFHSFLYSTTIALQCATDTEDVKKLRDILADALRDVAEVRRK